MAGKIVHGHTLQGHHTPEYRAWNAMKQRCLNPTHPKYRLYGARGIRIHEPWLHFTAFIRDIGLRPSAKHSLDRIDNDGHYEPGNVRWATAKEQTNNNRRNYHVTFQGRTLTISQWAHELGIDREVLRGRLQRMNWTPERALTEPTR